MAKEEFKCECCGAVFEPRVLDGENYFKDREQGPSIHPLCPSCGDAYWPVHVPFMHPYELRTYIARKRVLGGKT